MKIYTGTGDRGKTSLFSGERVAKNNERVEAYGEIDELNAVLGAVTVFLPDSATDVLEEIRRIQSDLFTIGAWLATTADSPLAGRLDTIEPVHISALETAIDRMDEELPALKGFILPGGHKAAAFSHVARTVCRRVERKLTALPPQSDASAEGDQFQNVLVYINRLSDYLFVLARHCNRISGKRDVEWHS